MKKFFKILIDGRMIEKNRMHGIARYVCGLLESLPQHPNFQFVVLVKKSEEKKIFFPDHIHTYPTTIPWLNPLEHFQLAYLFKKLGIDLFHATSLGTTLFSPCPVLMTLHDVNPLALPLESLWWQRFYYKFILPLCFKKTKKIITVSKFSSREIQKFYPMISHLIEVVPNGVSPVFQSIEDLNYLEEVKKKYDLTSDFFLCVSPHRSHKNLNFLLKVYEKLREKHSWSYPLVITSKPDNSLKKSWIKFIYGAPDEELSALYNLSKALIFPSLYEGFGLPALEALACGTSVLAASNSSLPEVLENQAYYFDPRNPQSLEKAFELFFHSSKNKKDLVQQSKKFSYENMSRGTLKIYEELLFP